MPAPEDEQVIRIQSKVDAVHFYEQCPLAGRLFTSYRLPFFQDGQIRQKSWNRSRKGSMMGQWIAFPQTDQFRLSIPPCAMVAGCACALAPPTPWRWNKARPSSLVPTPVSTMATAK